MLACEEQKSFSTSTAHMRVRQALQVTRSAVSSAAPAEQSSLLFLATPTACDNTADWLISRLRFELGCRWALHTPLFLFLNQAIHTG